MTKPDIDIKLLGDDELYRALRNLEHGTQHKVLKKIVRDTGTKVFKPGLVKAHPYNQIKRSIGTKTGRSRRVAAAFVGPRMVPGFKLTKKQRSSGRYQGYLAQIVEYNKGQKRKTSKGYNRGIMALSGRGRMRVSMKRNLVPGEKHIMKSLRTIIQREWNRAVKKGIA